jgi:hypothetical protein
MKRVYLSGQYQREQETMYSKVLKPADVLAAGDREDLNAFILERAEELQRLLKLHEVVRGKAFTPQENVEIDALCENIFKTGAEMLSEAEYLAGVEEAKIVSLSEAAKEKLKIRGPIPGPKAEESPIRLPPLEGIAMADDAVKPSLVDRIIDWFVS